MNRGTGLYLIVVIAFAASAQSIALSGTVSNQSGRPISGAVVSLLRQALADTTDANGAYSITGATAVNPTPILQSTERIFLSNGIVWLSLTKPEVVRIEMFDIRGQVLARALDRRVSGGNYRFDIMTSPIAAQIVVIYITIGQRVSAFRSFPLPGGKSAVSSSAPPSTGLERLLAAVQPAIDTVKASATGYVSKATPISSYQGVVNITLATIICGATPNPNPFGCSFAWGTNGGTPTTLTYLQFISNWAGYNIRADGTFSSFDAGNWLTRTMATATQVPAYYAYILGYYGHSNGLPDGNVNPNGPNLSNGMGTLLLGVDNTACPQGPPATICADHLMVKAYAWYATQTYAAYKKPVIWLLEGDLIQYSPSSAQTQKLTWTQFGQLVAQIVLAIKCNDPPAVVAVNYSSWMSNATMQLFFNAINTEVANLGTSYEMVWTTGQGTSANAGSGTTWAQLHTASGDKPILVDESFGLSAASDTWANQSAATINLRIAGGVQAINITTSPLPSYLQTNVTTTLAPSALNSTCP
jgi:YD repeat-containing protein